MGAADDCCCRARYLVDVEEFGIHPEPGTYSPVLLKPRCYDVSKDDHPCQLVVKYLSNNDDALGQLGNAILDWLEARGMEIPQDFRLQLRLHASL